MIRGVALAVGLFLAFLTGTGSGAENPWTALYGNGGYQCSGINASSAPCINIGRLAEAPKQGMETKENEQDPLARLKAEQQAARAKEQAEIRRVEEKLKKLNDDIVKMKNGMSTSAEASDSSLDAMFDTIHQKEQLQTRLEQLKNKLQEEEKRRQSELEIEINRLKDEQNSLKKEKRLKLITEMAEKREKHLATLKEDIRKYKEITLSPFGKDLMTAAWKALAAKYPKDAKGLEPGDTEALLFKAGYEGITNSIGMRFVLIPAGIFNMGSPEGETGRDTDEKRHKVILTESFYIQTTEVTRGQWREIMGSNASPVDDCGDECPAENVSWVDCQAFIRILNEREDTDKYRLPTEAEWEYACRAGSNKAFANGPISVINCSIEPNLDVMGWYCGNSMRRLHPVGQKQPNAWSVYDMHGSVWEWCQDWYGSYPSGSITDPQGRSFGPERVIRGGSFLNYARLCRSAARYMYKAKVRLNNIGFRIARSK
jgi:formylglycine-generating enzyme required for sulfatase activity